MRELIELYHEFRAEFATWDYADWLWILGMLALAVVSSLWIAKMIAEVM